jgi:integrase
MRRPSDCRSSRQSAAEEVSDRHPNRTGGLARELGGSADRAAHAGRPVLRHAHGCRGPSSWRDRSRSPHRAERPGGRHLARAPTTARIALITLGQVCRFAVRRGWLADNPVGKLEPGEKPRWKPKPVAILEGDDLARLLDHAGTYRPLFEFVAYTGLRMGEALGLTWADVDFDAGLIHVHRQLTRQGLHAALKTEAARREVILAAGLVKLLRERWLASAHKDTADYVFGNTLGRGLDYRDVGKRFRATVKAAGLDDGRGRVSMHSLRHTFASLLIANGLNIAFVSRQLGHANPKFTLATYAHLFDQADHAQAARDALDTSHAIMSNAGGSTALRR